MGELLLWWCLECNPGDRYFPERVGRIVAGAPVWLKCDMLAAASRRGLFGWAVETAPLPTEGNELQWWGMMNVFRARWAGKPLPYPDDPILGAR